MADADEFYDRITMLVKHKNITLLALCTMVDYNLRTYNVARQRKRFLKGDVIARMADVLGVSTDFLITGHECDETLTEKQETLWHAIRSLQGEALADATKMVNLCLQAHKTKHPATPKGE